MDYLSLEDFIKSRSLGFMTIDEFVASRSQFLSLDDYSVQRWGLAAKKRKDIFKTEHDERTNIVEMLEQFARGAGEEASLGATKYVIPRNDPEGIKESIAKGVGQFVGFLSPLGLVGKAKGIIKGTAEAQKIATAIKNIGFFSKYPKALKVAGHVIDTTTALSGAEALSEIISNPQETGQRAIHGAKIGALFGGVGLAHIPKHPILGNILRQFGGRTLMHFTGEYPIEGRFNQENLAQTVFDEALMTWFLSRGITADELMNGTKDKVKQSYINDIYASVDDVNSVTSTGEKLSISKQLLTKPIRKTMDFRDMVMAEKPSEELVGKLKLKLKQNIDISKDYPLKAYWDADAGKYATQSGSAFLEAKRRANIELQVLGQSPGNDVVVDIIRDKPGTKPRMKKPWELAVLFKYKSFKPELIEKLDATRYWAYDTKTGHVRPISEPVTLTISDATKGGAKIVLPSLKLQKTEIGLTTTLFDPVKRRWGMAPVSKGVAVPTFQWEGKKIFFRGKLDKRLEDIQIEKEILEKQLASLNIPTPPQTAIVKSSLSEEVGAIGPSMSKESFIAKGLEKDLNDVVKLREKVLAAKKSGKKLTKAGEDIDQELVFLDKQIQDIKNSLQQHFKDENIINLSPEDYQTVEPIPAISPSNVIQLKIDTLSNEAETIYKQRVSRYNQLDQALFKKGIKPVNIEKIINRAEQRINTLRKIPNAQLPETYKLLLNERLRKLGIGMDMDRFLLAFGIEDKIARYKHLEGMERKFLEMEKAPIGDRLGVLFSDFAREEGLQTPQLKGEFAAEAAPMQQLWQRRRNELFNAANWRAKNQIGSGSVLRQVFTMKRWWYAADVRKLFAHLQNLTGIPFFNLHKRIARKSYLAGQETLRVTEPLNKFYTMPAEDQAVVARWFSMASRAENTAALEATFGEAHLDLKNTIHSLMTELEPQIAKYRVMQWIKQVYDMRLWVSQGLKAPFKEPRIFRRQAALEPLLKEAADMYYRSIMPGGAGIFDHWLATKGKSLGVIGEGTYLPEFILSPRKKEYSLSYEQEASYIDVFGHGHLQSREPITDATGKLNLEKDRIDSFRDKHLTVRIHSYVNQVMNAIHLEPEIQKLDRLARSLGEDLSQAKPRGFGKIGPEAKGYSLLDLFRIYAQRMKRYPIKRGMMGEALIATQSMFFRALTPRPWMWLRNLPQRIITVPHKEFVTDPRYMSNQWKKLPQEIRDIYSSRGVDQESAFKQDFLELQTTEKIKHYPILKTFFTIAEKVGNIYSMSDASNRKSVFGKTYMRSTDYINAYMNNKFDYKTLEARLGIKKMELPEQNIIRAYIQDGNVKEAAFEIADWQTINSQWAYRRTEKSLMEMTSEGESWTNLLTWSKSVFQQCVDSASKIKDGADLIKQGNRPEGLKLMGNGALTIAGLGIAGMVGNAVLAQLSFSHKARFQSYGPDMFMWEFGGVTVEMLKGFTDTLGNIVTSFDGTPEERKRSLDEATKMFDNVMFRQMIPFAKGALAAIESVTGRSYISPLYEAYTKATQGVPSGKTYVQRNILEGIAHAILATDPNKSEDVRKWAFNKMYEYEAEAVKPSAMQWYYQAQATRFRYLNDLFQRYTPYELYQDRVKKEWLKKYKEIKNAESLRNYLYRGTKEQYELQRTPDIYR